MLLVNLISGFLVYLGLWSQFCIHKNSCRSGSVLWPTAGLQPPCHSAAKFWKKWNFLKQTTPQNVWPSPCPCQVQYGSVCKILQPHIVPFQNSWQP